ncbi:MAG: AmmeMemoRadiSam system radical SAM enzyme [Planctomycetota bacterium]
MSVSSGVNVSSHSALPIVPDVWCYGDAAGTDPIVAKWWAVDGDRVVCNLCPRDCRLNEGDRGFCFVRQNIDGKLRLTTYGRSTGFCIDPIEKKPLNHFLPGTPVLSFGTAGCNLGCKFCQNHSISKSREVEKLSALASPESIAAAAFAHQCRSVAFTYNDPVIWAEYAIRTAQACRERNIKSVAVTAGYISPEARAEFFGHMDAANVDLKSFSEEFYQKVTLSKLQPVLETLLWLKRESDVWFEITNLVIPNHNESDDELKRLCEWVVNNLGPDVPLHFSAFHPDFRLQDQPRTPHETLIGAYDIAMASGVKFVYLGNVHDLERQSTYCHSCGVLLIERDWHQLGSYRLSGSSCSKCHAEIPGRFERKPGTWGRKRQPVKIVQPSRRITSGISGTTNSRKPQGCENRRFVLDEQQQNALHHAACQFVLAESYKSKTQLADPDIGGIANKEVFGAFVSLKRGYQLRACVGFSGRKSTLGKAIAFAANRCVHHDNRFPAVQPHELNNLTLEVWLLDDLIKVGCEPEERVAAIKVGRDGLMIQKDGSRGLLLPGVAIDHGFDERVFLEQACLKAGLHKDSWRESGTTLYRFEGQVVKRLFERELLPPSATIQPGSKHRVRMPWVAGKFYPATESECRKQLEALAATSVATLTASSTGRSRSAMIPHAGWRFSGAVAMKTLAHTALAETVIILAPKHTAHGAAFAVSPAAQWRTPVGEIAVDSSLANDLVTNVCGMTWDDAAHARDHGIEVLLPMLTHFRPNLKIVPVAVGTNELKHCLQVGQQLGSLIKGMAQPVSLIVSSDMNHFESEKETRRRDQLALNALVTRNPAHIYQTVRQHRISMCGVMPLIIGLQALNTAGLQKKVQPVVYSNSSVVSGNKERVVGYAGVLL